MRRAAHAMFPKQDIPHRPALTRFRTRAASALAILSLLTVAAPAKDVDVRFIVVAPGPPAAQPDQIYMSTSLDEWPEAGRPLKKIADGLYETMLPLQAGSGLSYKFLREKSWGTVEKDPRGFEVANRDLVVAENAPSMIVFNDIATWADQTEIPMRRAKHVKPASASGAASDPDSTRVGEIRQHPTILNEKTGEIREAHVYLPPDYEKDAKRRYPVLYLQDGQNVFDAETAFGGAEWEADETLERMIRSGELPPMIVVAIYNSPERRAEYSPFADEEMKTGDGAKKYLSFVVETIKPVIDKTYRTIPDRANTAIGGASLGGTVSLYAAFEFPKVFGTALVLSPAVHCGEEPFLDYLAKAPMPEGAKIWMDMGTEEGKNAEDRAATMAKFRKFAETLGARAASAKLDLHVEEIPGAAHHETSWRARFGRILQWAYGKK